MTDDMYSHSGIGLFGYIILFVIIVWVFGGAFGGGFGWNRGGCAGAEGFGVSNGLGFQNYKAICDSEKAQIVNTATTQFLIEQQSANNRELIQAQTNAINTKIDYYGYQNERDKNADLQRQVVELRNQLFVKDQLAPINAQLASIQCNMLRRPDITGVGVACPSAAILNGLGVNSLNQCSGCNGVVI
ncbi:MAG: hypothetical protein ACI4S3_07400 [Candidatus Gastranaerophilaceae bacterium]